MSRPYSRTLRDRPVYSSITSSTSRNVIGSRCREVAVDRRVEAGDAHFLPHQRLVLEPAVAQADLLARHLLVVLLEREEVRVAARLLDLDRLRLERVPELLGQPHVAGDVPDAAVGVAVGMRHRGDDRRLARADRHEEVREEEPAVVVGDLRVGETARRRSPWPVSVSRVACCRSVRPVTPSGYSSRAVRVAVRGDELLEAGAGIP